MLVLMGLVLVCLVADEYGEAQRMGKQTAASTCMAVVVDDFDLDDDDDELIHKSFVENKAWASIPMRETIGQKAEGSKCSKALLRGQVRRYSPRKNLRNSHNYVILKNPKSGVDSFLATFFVLFSKPLTYEYNRYYYSYFDLDSRHRCFPDGLPFDEFAS